MSISLGTVSLAGAGIGGVITVLTKKYQKKLSKVTKLTDVIMPVIVVLERWVSKALKNGKIDEKEFNLIQKLRLEMINELMGVDLNMVAENRNQFEKNILEEINVIKKNIGTRV